MNLIHFWCYKKKSLIKILLELLVIMYFYPLFMCTLGSFYLIIYNYYQRDNVIPKRLQ